MKLVYLTNVRLPTEKAHGLQIMKMCEAFAEAEAAAGGVSFTTQQGDFLTELGGVAVGEHVEVELVVPRRLNSLTEDPFTYYGVKKNFKITRIPCLDLISFNLGQIGYWIEMVTFLVCAKMYLAFKKYDILYTREFALGVLFKKYILEVHDLPEQPTPYHIYAWKKAHKLVVLTRFLKEDLMKWGVEDGRVMVAADGVDLNSSSRIEISKVSSVEPSSNTSTDAPANAYLEIRGKLRTQLNLPTSKKIALYAGSFYLHDWKGVDTFLESSRKLDRGIQVVCVGGTDEEIFNISKQYQHTNIILIPRVKHELISQYLRAADMLILPNKKGNANSERYTSPLKLFEYMASGTPIIASDLPSLREVLNEKNCTFFTAGDPISLAQAISTVAGDLATEDSGTYSNKDSSNASHTRAAQALKDVQKYTWNRRAQSILQFALDTSKV